MNDTLAIRASGRQSLALVGLTVALMLLLFRGGMISMVRNWQMAEYSHGYLIPFVAGWMALQKVDRAKRVPMEGSWLGPVCVVLSILLLTVGELSTLRIVTQYALLGAVIGVVISFAGVRMTVIFWAPLLFLTFMIKLPDFLYNNLSNQLQLISSALGVAVIRTLGIPVFLEGNVIDLGVYKLQVVDACSGLRYLFPLVSFGFFCAFLYRGSAWKRIALFLSTIPIAILMNSLRVGIIGALVEYQGIEAAQGFLHLFEGWAVFLLCLAILFVEALVLHQLPRRTGSFRDALALDLSLCSFRALHLPALRRQMPLTAATSVIAAAVLASLFFTERTEIQPRRDRLATFPLKLGDWQGQEQGLPSDILNWLKLDDYINANFTNSQTGDLVNLYIAYYASQRKGASAHSPASCIPAGGWEIEQLSYTRIHDVGFDPEGLPVNRVIIGKGASRQLVYYWFQERGRFITNEYLVKWYLLVDAIKRNRTDGALVRLVTPLPVGQDSAIGDELLQRFLRDMTPELGRFIPGEGE